MLEVGSLNINGSVRDFFADCDYVGLDVGVGKDVDIVCEGQKYDAPDESFDQVISCEAMEHNPYWVETLQNMVRMAKPGALITMTCATTGRPEHGTTRTMPSDSPLSVGIGWDYYRNLRKQDFEKSVDLGKMFLVYQFWTNWRSFDLYFCGIKRGEIATVPSEWAAALEQVNRYVVAANKPKVCVYRSVVSRCLGDKWYAMMRKFAETLAYVHSN